MKTEAIKKLYDQFGLSSSDVYSHKHYKIITRSGIEKIQAKAKIEIKYDVIACQPDFCAIKATSLIGAGRTLPMQTFGSAKHGGRTQNQNGKWVEQGNTTSWYIAEIAEKRAMARLVLKVTGFYELGFFSEDESDDFKATLPKINPKQLAASAKRLKEGTTTLEEIKRNFTIMEDQEEQLISQAL